MITSKKQNNTLIISVNGKIDSANATMVEKELLDTIENNLSEQYEIDAEKLTYISSAGLRVMLRLKKAYKNIKLVNVSAEVYDIFEMTGFTQIIDIEKAYRKFSVEGCEVIGQGANGKVYRLDEDTIVKVYMNSDSLPEIHRERELARKAFVMGIPTAIPYDVVKIDDKYGSVFELLNAQSFSKLIYNNPNDIDKYIDLYIDLLKQIHSTELKEGELPNMNTIALQWVVDLKGDLSESNWEKLYSLVSSMPNDLHMIHGDYHTKNVMMQNDEVLLIDMDTLAVGNPIYEWSFMYNAYVAFEEFKPKEERGGFLGLNAELTQQMWEKSLKCYFADKSQEEINGYINKIKIISYIRILRRSLKRLKNTPEGKILIESSRNRLEELLPQVDSLTL